MKKWALGKGICAAFDRVRQDPQSRGNWAMFKWVLSDEERAWVRANARLPAVAFLVLAGRTCVILARNTIDVWDGALTSTQMALREGLPLQPSELEEALEATRQDINAAYGVQLRDALATLKAGPVRRSEQTVLHAFD